MDRHSVNWRGYLPAITTPFTESGDLDVPALHRLLDWLLQEGMHGILVAGTQGEWFSLSQQERALLFKEVGQRLRGKMTLIAGCSALTAREVAENAAVAAEAGFDGILVTPPPYMVPDESEILAFYSEVNEAVSLPICVYNWPPGTNVDMSVDLLEALSGLSKVVAIKNSTGDLRRFLSTFFRLKDRVRVFGVPMNELGVCLVQHFGADGTMGAGAVLGSELPDYFNAIWEGDTARALRIGQRNDLLMSSWFNDDYTGRLGSAQATFKAALNMLDLPGGFPRRPLTPMGPEGLNVIRDTLRTLGKM